MPEYPPQAHTHAAQHVSVKKKGRRSVLTHQRTLTRAHLMDCCDDELVAVDVDWVRGVRLMVPSDLYVAA